MLYAAQHLLVDGRSRRRRQEFLAVVLSISLSSRRRSVTSKACIKEKRKGNQQDVDSNQGHYNTALGKARRLRMQDEQKLKRRRVGSTKKALCLTVVTDVGFFHEKPSLRRILGFRFSKRDSIHSGPARHWEYCPGWLYTPACLYVYAWTSQWLYFKRTR